VSWPYKVVDHPKHNQLIIIVQKVQKQADEKRVLARYPENNEDLKMWL
jgi:hypothetical protein